MSTIKEGSVVEGVITGITKFGAFVELPEGNVGLVHISEVADSYVKDVKDFFKENEKVKVKVINVDEKGKIGLSIKQAEKNNKSGKNGKSSSRQNTASFEDKVAKFMKESDEKQTDLKKSTDSKRGGRSSKNHY